MTSDAARSKAHRSSSCRTCITRRRWRTRIPPPPGRGLRGARRDHHRLGLPSSGFSLLPMRRVPARADYAILAETGGRLGRPIRCCLRAHGCGGAQRIPVHRVNRRGARRPRDREARAQPGDGLRLLTYHLLYDEGSRAKQEARHPRADPGRLRRAKHRRRAAPRRSRWLETVNREAPPTAVFEAPVCVSHEKKKAGRSSRTTSPAGAPGAGKDLAQLRALPPGWLYGTNATPSRRPSDTRAGTSISPLADFTLTVWPSATPRRCASAVFSSTKASWVSSRMPGDILAREPSS